MIGVNMIRILDFSKRIQTLCFAITIFLFHSLSAHAQELAIEKVPDHEAEAIASIVESLKIKLEKDYPEPERTLRDAHPKQHGLVKADFIILDNIDPSLKTGLFAEPRSYEAWIRYSNLADGKPDIKKDSRGMAIKLMGVEGTKLLPNEANAKTHDLSLIHI